MKQFSGYLKVSSLTVLLGSALVAGSTEAQAVPTGLQVVNGQASLQQNGGQLTVTNSNNAILNWNSFSIGAGNSVRFVQPGSSSQVLNRVVGNDPSSILGSLSSNGRVWLLNPNGVLFGANARVDVASLVTSTLNLSNGDWLSGRYRFTGGDTAAAIDNQGQIRSALGGQVALIGGSVNNEGLIEASGGQITLAAGQSVELVDTGAPNLAVKVTAPSGRALNLGSLRAGSIDVMAAAVNQEGLVQADSLTTGPQGEILLQAGERLTLADGSTTRADGAVGGSIKLLGREIALLDGSAVSASGANGGGTILVGGGAQGQDPTTPHADAVYVAPGASLSADALTHGDGGHIVLWSDIATRAFGRFSARAGAEGGNGGLVETSGHWLDARPAALDVSAPRGAAGTWLLDPFNILISDSVSGAGTDAAFTATANDAEINSGTLVAALNQGANVTISTGTGGTQEGTITISEASFTGLAPPAPVSLTITANSDINISNSTIDNVGNAPMSVVLNAGAGGTGAITVIGSSITSNGGDITLGGFGANGAAIAHGSVPDGVYIDASSINAGAGALSITGESNVVGGRGVLIGSSFGRFSAGNLTINGLATGGPGIDGPLGAGSGVQFEAGSFEAGQQLAITGSGDVGVYVVAGSSQPISMFGGSGVSIAGTSTAGNYGVLLDNAAAIDAPVLLQAEGPVSISGSNTGTTQDALLLRGAAGGFLPTLSVAGDVSLTASGGGMVLQDVITTDNFASESATSGPLTSLVASSDSSLLIDGGYLYAQGRIDLQAQQVSLANAAVLAPGPQQIVTAIGEVLPNAVSDTALMISGPGGTGPAQSFDNQAGPQAISLDPNGTARWILWLDDATAPGALNLGGLTYDFQRYGATDSSAWAGDVGNGVVSLADKFVVVRGTVASRVYDGTTAAVASNLSFTPEVLTDQIQGSLGPYAANFVTKNAGTDKLVVLAFDPTVFSYLDAQDRPVYGYRYLSALRADVTPATLRGTVTGVSRVYDGGLNATVNIAGITGFIGIERVTVTGTGSFADKNVGQGKAITVNYAIGDGINGGLALNYQFQPLAPVGANITPATLSFLASRIYVPGGTSGSSLPPLGGSVNGFVGGDTLASATTGIPVFVSSVGDTAVPGVYAINGQGLTATNYRFVQDAGNATALIIGDTGPQSPVTQNSGIPVRKPSLVAVKPTDTTTSGTLDLTPGAPGRGSSGSAPGSTPGSVTPSVVNFDSVPLDAMSLSSAGDLLDARAALMQDVLGDALDKLRKNPNLADVGPCRSLKDALLGTCLVTEAMKAEFAAAKAAQAATSELPVAATAPAAARPVPRLPPPLFGRARVKTAALPEIRRKVAVLIGEGHYVDPRIPSLANAVGDANAVAATLAEQLGYEVLVLENPSKETLISTLNRLAMETGPQDSAIVFYAGHGAVVDPTGAGYWLMSTSQSEDPRTWLSNADIARLIEQIGARQMVLISDSCYSGGLVGGARIRGTPGEVNPKDVLARRSTVVMSSGGNEPVFDSGRGGHSLFAWSLMNTLSQVKAWRLGGNLFERIRFTVARELPQRPQYGAAPGYQEGGDYLFEVRELDVPSSGERAPG